jgi:hypothetical protein
VGDGAVSSIGAVDARIRVREHWRAPDRGPRGADNVRSNVALHKLGARKEGILRAAFVRDGRHVDQQLWAIVAGLDA